MVEAIVQLSVSPVDRLPYDSIITKDDLDKIKQNYIFYGLQFATQIAK